MTNTRALPALMPNIFLAHGSPMNAIEDNIFTADWHRIMQGVSKPRAVVIFSAHWHVPGIRIQQQAQQQTIHDFGGFPQALFNQQYPATGEPLLAQKIHTLLANNDINAELVNDWGLDHGSWVPLMHLYPEADIPCLQISLDNSSDDLHYHFNIAKALKPLRRQGVLFIGSGNIVHNIAKWMRSAPSDSIEWASSFDAAIVKAIEDHDFDTIVNYQQLAFAAEAVPTIEHFLPLAYNLGLSDEEDAISSSDFGFHDLSTACSRSIRFG